MIDFKFVRVDDQHMGELTYVAKCLGVPSEEALAIIINSAYEKIRYVFDPVIIGTTLGHRIRVVRTWHDAGFYLYSGVVFKDGYAPENAIVDAEDVDVKNIELADGGEYTNCKEAYFHICEILYHN